MIYIFGTRTFGKVDHVPGLFYVSTKFFHINFVPLIPLTTYVLIEGSDRGAQISMSFKSIVTAWARLALIIGLIVLFVIGCFSFLAGLAAKDVVVIASAFGLFFASLMCGGLFWATYRFGKASHDRAMFLADHLGLSRALVRKRLDPTGIHSDPDDLLEAEPVFADERDYDDRDRDDRRGRDRDRDEYDRRDRDRDRDRDDRDRYDYDRRDRGRDRDRDDRDRYDYDRRDY